ncbi:hypothetical protein CXG81DRAFT_28655 [Caulochytrium protostelioides]|uniref:Alkaline phosphatase-like protein n=1 Tax=Caulochytrium protostelioides TaxID=1555241 RepID=A0A4P9WYI8_9FUNG|nr:hypothetical protein CXG81DRAFT_28655 [Caulochytrium protostelioides]|eukprot:RKO98524.1 hypothetical protein CXG81DRAFT_28655 [Caulochytrium protostelioides]
MVAAALSHPGGSGPTSGAATTRRWTAALPRLGTYALLVVALVVLLNAPWRWYNLHDATADAIVASSAAVGSGVVAPLAAAAAAAAAAPPYVRYRRPRLTDADADAEADAAADAARVPDAEADQIPAADSPDSDHHDATAARRPRILQSRSYPVSPLRHDRRLSPALRRPPSAAQHVMAARAPAAPPVMGDRHRDVNGTVLLVSLDGFRASYLERGITPRLNRMRREGLAAPRGMQPAFPSMTFPNHWTLVTGLYPESHGIVANRFRDTAPPFNNASFVYKDATTTQDARWWGGEPIWRTAARGGARAAVCLWPGSNAPVGGAHADAWVPFSPTLAPADKIQWALAQAVPSLFPDGAPLPLETRDAAGAPVAAHNATAPPARLLTLYFNDVDVAAHRHGTHANATNAAVAHLDGVVGALLDAFDAHAPHVNVVVVSDHGMADSSPDRLVSLAPWVDPADYTWTDNRPLFFLEPRRGREDAVRRGLAAGAATWGAHLRVFARGAGPDRFHYNGVPPSRVPTWVLIAAPEWSVVRHDGERPAPGEAYDPAGLHGHDNRHPSMRALFMARGPAIRPGGVIEAPPVVPVAVPVERPPANDNDASLANIEIYSFLAMLLNVPTAPNNATAAGQAAFADALYPPAPLPRVAA